MSGIERIAKERQRQVSVDGWTPEHDDEHIDGALATVAALYATPDLLYAKIEFANRVHFADPWPAEWGEQYDKRPFKARGNELLANQTLPITKRIRQLEKAGALIAAEIDRLERAGHDQPKAIGTK